MRLRKSFWLSPLLVPSCVFLLTASIPNVPTGTWQTWNPMGDVRSGAAAVRLRDGRALMIGGNNANGPVASADLFGTDGNFSAAAVMQSPRSGHTATVLSDGRVLVAGGTTSGGGITNSAEIYDPSADSWTLLSGTMVDARSGHTASLLPDGRVLLAGGQNSGGAINSLEIFDPSSGNFSGAGVMASARMNHAAASLQDGRVLLLGGSDGTNPLASVDVFDPSAGTVSAGPNLSSPRVSASATATLDGRVVVIGGNNGASSGPADLATADILVAEPSAGQLSSSLSASNLLTPRSGHQSFLLPKNNAILVIGGSSSGTDLNSAELYYSWADTFQATGSMSVPRPGFVGSAISQDGVFLAAGGTNLSSTELYGFATVKTDAADYPPGSTVTITGSGWQPGETVTLTLVESPLIDTHGPFTTVADANGNISNSSVATDTHDVNVRFYLTAVGSQSQAQNTFTDAKAVPTTTITSHTPNPSVFGQAITFNVSVTSTSTVSEGCVHIEDSGTTVSGLVQVVSGAASVSVSTLAVGTHSSLTAVYTDTGNGCTNGNTFSGSTSAVVSQTVNAANTSTVLGSSANPSVFGQSVTFTATVSDASTGSTGTPTGTVTFKDGATTLGTGTLSSGVATFSTSALSVSGSPHSITAVYAGDSNFSGSTSSALSQAVNNPVPAITTLSPSSATAGAAAQTLTINGSNFVSTSTVTYNGVGHTATFVSSTQLTISLSAADQATAGTYPVVVTNPTPGGGASNSVNFTVNNPVPATSSISPALKTAGDGGFTLTVNGTNFNSTSVVNFNGSARTTTLVNSTQVTASITATDVATVGTFPITVTNPAPGGGTSNSQTLTVNPKLVFTTNAFATLTGLCSPTISVQLQNGNGSAATLGTSTTLNLSSSQVTGKFFSDTGCTSQITSTTIAAGSSTANFFYDDTSVGSPVITVASTGLTSVTQTEAITGLRFPTTAFSVQINSCSLAITLQSANSSTASPTSLTQLTTINLSSSSVGGKFYSDSGCTTLITTTSIGPNIDGGHTSSNFYYKDTTAGSPTLTGSAGTASATQTETVVAPPAISKAFGASTIAVNGTTSLTFTITNPAANTVAESGVAFSDSFPAGLVVANPNGLSNTCGGTPSAAAGATTVGLTGGTVAISSTCTLSVNVTGTTSGVKDNTTGAVSSTNGGTGNTASASITVASPPTISKAFGASSIPYNGSTSLTFTITNPNTIGLTGLAFTDSLPGGLVVATPNGLTSTCGTAAAVAGSGSVSLSGGTVTASNTCSISVNVTGTVIGTLTNTTGTITSTESGAGSTSNTVSLTVNPASSTTKVTLSPSAITFGQSTTVTATVTPQFSGTPTGSVSVSDGLGGAGDTCTITLASGTGTCSLTPSAAAPSGLAVTGTYSGDSNFTAGTPGTATLTVNKATATINVTPYTVTYDATAHTATGTATGVGSVDLSAGLNLTGTTHTNAGTYNGDAWSFHDASGNYADASGTVNDKINQATATINVVPYTVTYDATAHTATGTATGVASVNLSTGLTLTGTTHTNAGTYNGDAWSFHDASGNYADASGTVSDLINQAMPAITWNNLADITYGTPLTGTQLNAKASVSGTFTYVPAAGTVLNAGPAQTLSAVFTPLDPVDYATVSAAVQIKVTQATPLIVWNNPADITYGTALGSTQLNAIALPVYSLKGWWKAEEDAKDSVGGNDGTPQGGTTYTTGEVGQAFSFPDSSGDGVTIPYNSAYDMNAHGFTASFWMQGSPNANGQETVFEKSYDGSTGWSFQVNGTTGKLEFDIGQGSASPSFTQVLSTGNVLDGNFHLIVGTWDGGTTMSLYVDGISQGTATLKAAPAINNGGLNIGFSSGNGTPGQYFQGAVDEVQIFGQTVPAGPFTYAPLSGTVLNAGNGQTLSVTFTPTDGTDLTSATKDVSINVKQATASISVTPYNVTYDGNAHTARGRPQAWRLLTSAPA